MEKQKKEEITKEDYERALLFPMDAKIVYAYEEQERKKIGKVPRGLEGGRKIKGGKEEMIKVGENFDAKEGFLSPNCSEAVYKIDTKGLENQIRVVKELINNRRLILDFSDISVATPRIWDEKKKKTKKVLKIECFEKEIQAIIPKDKWNVYCSTFGFTRKSRIEKNKRVEIGISEKREVACKMFEKAVRTAEFYRKWFIKKYPDGLSEQFYIAINGLRIFPNDMCYSDNDIIMGWDKKGDWKLTFNIESHIDDKEFEEMEEEAKKYVKNLLLIEKC